MKQLTRHINILLTALAIMGTLSACNSTIYDDEGDCLAHYIVDFKYDYNVLYANAFDHEVETVTLHVLDSNGNVVWRKTAGKAELESAGNAIEVDVATGKYSLLAWAGDAGHESFNIDDEATRRNNLGAKLLREHEADGKAISAEELSKLYHAYVADVEFPATEGEHRTTMSLTKDTNYIKIILQQVSHKAIDIDKLAVTITDDNGSMDWNNALLPDETIIYKPWMTTPLEADMDSETARAGGYMGVMCEFTVPRLMIENKDSTRLTVVNTETGENVFSLKLIDYLLKIRGNYDRPMKPQEYLDRENKYEMVFFLDHNMDWASAYIYINSWMVVTSSADFE